MDSVNVIYTTALLMLHVIKYQKHCNHILNLNADYLEKNLCKEIAVLYVGISLHA